MDVFKTLLLDTPDSLNAITGTLQIANGGTGATSAAGARDNLLPDYTGNVGKVLTVNAGATDVEWTTNGAGTVTSVDVSGGTTGLTTSGGPVTSSGTITLAGTLAVANGGTGITSLGSGVATFLGTPSSANLAAAVTDETGTGALVFANSPTLVTPALGTPASGVVTNLTGTASININGTVGATTPSTVAATTGTFSGSVKVSGPITNAAANSVLFAHNGTDAQVWALGPNPSTQGQLVIVPAQSDASGAAVAATFNASGGNGAWGATTPSTGAFTTLSASSLLQVAAAGRFTGNGLTGATGAGVELLHDATTGTIASYNRTTSAYKALNIDALSTNLQVSGSTIAAVSSTGLAVTGTLSSTTGANFATSSGNVGIGTASPGAKLDIVQTGAEAALRVYNSQAVDPYGLLVDNTAATSADANYIADFRLAGTSVLSVRNSGNVGIGTTSPASKLHVSGAGADIRLTDTQVANATWRILAQTGNTTKLFRIFDESNVADRLVINSSGNVLIGTTTAPTIAGVPSGSSVVGAGGGDWTWSVQSTSASSNRGMVVHYSAAAPNDTGNEMLFCYDSGATRFAVRSNGGIANYQANDVNLSDERVKTAIIPVESYLDKMCAIEVVKYKYKDQTHDDYNLGVIAQQVEAVAPEFVDADGFNPLRNDEIPLKAIYQTDLSYGILKAVQELAEENKALRARVFALEND